ncbi:MAG: hypothetical protein EXX96DRAFT_484936 [Benjaminiella poitrasii]|nr:MAG: hypothetical protein EXX96DRAFT_484936 [Benjaminiella poitrasii]
MSQQSLRLRNPNTFHLMATGQHTYSQDACSLADAEHFHQGGSFQLGLSNNHSSLDSPNTSEQNKDNHIDFHDSFSQQHLMHPTNISSPNNDYEDYHHPLYDRTSSFSSTNNMDNIHHRRSSGATDISSSLQSNTAASNHHQPVFIPGSNNHFDSTGHSLAMSAPANMGYDYYYEQHQHPFSPHQMNQSSNNSNIPATSTSPTVKTDNDNSSLARSFEDDYTMQMNMQLIMEKRRRRRESHNAGTHLFNDKNIALFLFFYFTSNSQILINIYIHILVERRRRDNINERIQELCSLLPETYLFEGGSSNSNTTNNKPNKGFILKKSVDHIRQLQQEVQTYHKRVEELERTLKMYQQRSNNDNKS